MALLDAFEDFAYPNEIGPGVYDIHSPNVPSRESRWPDDPPGASEHEETGQRRLGRWPDMAG